MSFFETVGGQRFINHTVPTLVKSINHLAEVMEKQNEKKEQEEQGGQTFTQNMYSRILRFAEEEDFECALSKDANTMKQLHSLWVGYCIFSDYEVDTASYDSDIDRLWNVLSNNTTNPFINFTDFDNYMCDGLV